MSGEKVCEDHEEKMREFMEETHKIIDILGELTEEIKKDHKPFVFCYSLILYAGYLSGFHFEEDEEKDRITKVALLDAFHLGFDLGKKNALSEADLKREGK